MDEVFRALADPTRRSLLDELFREDGQTLSALEERFAMTRFGVMKHLKRARGGGPRGHQAARPREAPLPEPRPDPARPRPVGEQVRRALGRRAQRAQDRLESPMEKVFEIYIKTTPERLWEAITDPEIRSKYNFGVGVESDWTPGSRYEMSHPGAGAARRGREPRGRPAAPAGADDDRALERRREERGHVAVTWEIEPVGDVLPPDRHPRPAARGRERPALRRLADDPLRPEDLARDGRAADHARAR